VTVTDKIARLDGPSHERRVFWRTPSREKSEQAEAAERTGTRTKKGANFALPHLRRDSSASAGGVDFKARAIYTRRSRRAIAWGQDVARGQLLDHIFDLVNGANGLIFSADDYLLSPS
jgi:hypothetical protein